jgi:predicted nucleotidyltransferase
MAKMTLEELVAQLRAAFGAELRSVVLYGSAASGEHVPKLSDYNVLVLVDALDVARLDAVAAVVRAWNDAGNPPPFTLTTEEWRRSADVFPMEYSDIQERHRVLYGSAPFDVVRVAPADLRRQLESEAMGKLLHLRQGVLAAGGDGRRQLELLTASKSTIMVLFRATMRLHSQTPPTDTAELCREVGRLSGLDPEPFIRVVRHVRGEEKVKPGDARPLLTDYVRGVQQLVAHLDRYADGG